MGLGPVREWFDARLRAAMEVIDPEYAADLSKPAFLAIASGSMLAVICTVAFVPPISAMAQFEHPWVSILLVLVGTLLTTLAHLYTLKTRIGKICTLLDTGCYSSAVAFAAIDSQGAFATAWAIALALMLLGFQSRGYGLSLLFALVIVVPIVGLLVAFRPPVLITMILLATCIMTLAQSELTRQRVLMDARHRRLRQALGAAEHVAEESMQAALGTTLLSLGHFLHELRNLQTVTSTDLAFLELHANLDKDCSEVLDEARDAQAKMTKLVTDTIESLKQRSRSVNAVFSLQDVVERVVRESRGADVSATGGDLRFVLHGNPEHMHAVLQNLVRNAIQAGARTVRMETQLEQSGQAVALTVHDDGPGIPESQAGRLFEAFTESTKIEGTGLGLYLCRRYVGLFGGTIEAVEGPLGGAAFRIRLPGRVATASGGPTQANVAHSA